MKIKYGVECPECGARLFSWYRHDYKTCGCDNQAMVDGGDDYTRTGWINKRPKEIRHSVKKDGPRQTPKVDKSRWPY